MVTLSQSITEQSEGVQQNREIMLGGGIRPNNQVEHFLTVCCGITYNSRQFSWISLVEMTIIKILLRHGLSSC